MARTTIVVGAGATLSDAMSRPIKSQPPLDKGFFRGAKSAGASGLQGVQSYLRMHYSLEPTDPDEDSLEKVMAVLYSDLNNPAAPQSQAAAAFRGLLRLLHQRLASTTNPLKPSPKSNLYRLIRWLLSRGTPTEDIVVVTFNQDLQIERTLWALQTTKALNKKAVLEFPHCYRLPSPTLTSPTSASIPVFPKSSKLSTGIEVLKLHGSLNWFSRHTSRNASPKSLLNPTRSIAITTRQKMSTELTLSNKRTV